MEAASRPPLELLPDLPVEEALDPTAALVPPYVAPAPSVGSASAPAQGSGPAPAAPPAASGSASEDTGQTGLNFVDPELFLGAGQKPSAVPIGAAGTQQGTAEPRELVLEDPVVDDLLAAPAPPAARVPPPLAPRPPPVSLTPPSGKPAASSAATARTSAPVPIARTASLAAAASKVAAANAAKRPTANPVAQPAKAVPPATRSAPPGPAPAVKAAPAVAKAAPVNTTGAASAASAKADSSKAQASTLASWTNARAAAAAPRVSAAPPVPTIAAPPPQAAPVRSVAPRPAASAATNGAVPVANTAAPAPSSATSAPTNGSQGAAALAAPPMDRDFIARNQVVERYLSGRLPVKGATDFERFCHDNPELLDEIGLPERVNAGLRLLEASGKPEPWQEAARPAWQKPQVTIALAASVAVLALTLAIVGAGSAGKTHRITELQKQATERALDPATSRREIRLLPSRSGASNSPAITIGSVGGAQLADFKIDESRSPYHIFRVTIDRIDQGRVGIISNLTKDSNGHLRIALNSSALGPGNYQLTLEGLDWRGEPQPDSWVTIGIVR